MIEMRDTVARKLGLTENDVFVFKEHTKLTIRLEDGEFVQIFW